MCVDRYDLCVCVTLCVLCAYDDYGCTGTRERLKAARELFDEGLIDEADFKKAKADIVSTLSRVFQ